MNQTIIALARAVHLHPSSNFSQAATADPVHFNMMMKLLLLSSLATIGTIGNVFAVSAVMLDDHLKRKGNVFIVNLAIADFVVSAFAIPASSVTILAGNPDNLSVCTFQWIAAILCCHISILTLMFIALENQARILSTDEEYQKLFGKSEVIVAISATWTISSVCVVCQFSLGLGPDYCRMIFKGHVFYHLLVGAFLFCVPTVVAFSAYLRCLFALRDTKSFALQNALLTSPSLAKDADLMKTNFAVFLVFLAFWFPLGIAIAVGSLRPISRRLYEHLSWMALSNSCINSFIYGIRNRFFRAAYTKLFHYCFCKTSVSFGRSSAPPSMQSRRNNETNSCGTSVASTSSTNLTSHYHSSLHHHHYHHASSHHHASGSSSSRPAPDVRVHIIPGYNIYAPQRNRGDASGLRESKSARVTSKDVYEL